MSENGRKKSSLLAAKLASTSSNKVVLQKSREKQSVNKRILFLLNRKSVSTDRNIGKVKQNGCNKSFK